MAIISIGYHNRLSNMEWQPWHHPVAADAKLQWRWWDICHTCQLNLWDSPSHSRHLWFRLSSTCPEKKVPEKWHGAMDETAKKISRLWTFHRPLSLALSIAIPRVSTYICVLFLLVIYLSYTHISLQYILYIIYISLSLSLTLSLGR